jgi:dihydroorotate dehydrogenase
MINRAGRVYRALFRTVAQRMDAETAHRLGFGALRAAAAVPGGAALMRRACAVDDPALAVHALGLDLPGPLGLAAGFDKDARGVTALAALGFGFVEVGTVTAAAQPGNPRPRLFRLASDRAIVNRMGFNNDGSAAVAARLRRHAQRTRRQGRRIVVGVNIGKSAAVPDEQAVVDYVASARRLAASAGYLVVNVSSPNTTGLRDLQAVQRLRPLLTAVRTAADRAAGRHVPLLVKIAPDLTDEDVLAVADLALELGLDGIVATNTTTSRDGLQSTAQDVAAAGAGGLSGPPLRERSVQVLKLLRSRVGDRLVLVSVGGVETAADVAGRLHAGATLVQAYTAFVYGGPMWPCRVNRELARQLRTRTAVAR